MIIFDGYQLAAEREAKLKAQVDQLKQQGQQLTIAALYFVEDKGSQIYTTLKRETARKIGISYQVFEFSLRDSVEEIQKKIRQLNQDETITGIIVQKPWRKTWLSAHPNGDKKQFNDWWQSLTREIELEKDVDGLHPETLAAVKAGSWQEQGRVLPATAKAVLEILDEAKKSVGVDFKQSKPKIIILGKSDIVGQPLYFELQNQGFNVEMIGSAELKQRQAEGKDLLDADIIISATGRQHLIKGEMVKEGVIVIDVGEPKPDVDFSTVSKKASFITPVPGGVGPMTVICLLENCVDLVN